MEQRVLTPLSRIWLSNNPRYTWMVICLISPAFKSGSGYPKVVALWKDSALTEVWALWLQDACRWIANVESAKIPKVQDHKPRHVVKTVKPICGSKTPTVISGQRDRVQNYYSITTSRLMQQFLLIFLCYFCHLYVIIKKSKKLKKKKQTKLKKNKLYNSDLDFSNNLNFFGNKKKRIIKTRKVKNFDVN